MSVMNDTIETILTIIPTVEESTDYVFMNEIEQELESEGGEED